MKKIVVVLVICLICFTGCNSSKKDSNKDIDMNKAKELPKLAFIKLDEYVKANNVKNVAKNAGEFDIKSINIGEGEELYLNNNSYYYIIDGSVYMYAEYTYEGYLCKLTINNNENNIGGFSCNIIDKEK